MRNFKLAKFGLVGIALLMLIQPGRAWAGGEDLGTNVSEDNGKSTIDLGTGKFSQSPFRVSISLRGGYDTNVNTTHFDQQESSFISIGGTLAYNFGDPRTQLSLTMGGGLTYYLNDVRTDNGTNYDANVYLSLSATHKATPRLTFASSLYLSYQTAPDFTVNTITNRRSGDFFFTSDKFSMSYLWTPKFSTVTSYTVGVVNYADNVQGAVQDRWENTLGNEFRFLVWPTTSLIAEYRYEWITYDTNFLRDSRSQFLLGGFDHSFSPRLTASVRAGAEFRDYLNGNTGNINDPYFEGTLIYALGKQTSLSWTTRYGLEEPYVTGSVSSTAFRTGLSARHAFTGRISGLAAVFFEHDDNAGYNTFFVRSPAFTENTFDLALSLRYAINRVFAVEGGYDFTDVNSQVNLRSYNRNRIWGGVNFSF